MNQDIAAATAKSTAFGNAHFAHDPPLQNAPFLPFIRGRFGSFRDNLGGLGRDFRSGVFVGLENYLWLWDDAIFWLAVFNTAAEVRAL